MRYEIKGNNFPIVECYLEAGEKMHSQSGGMIWMSPNMRMDTQGGGIGKMFSRMITGETMFQNIYTAEGGHGMITFGSSFPGQIKELHIAPGRDFILQKRALLAYESTVEFSVFLHKKLGTGFFGGEGFIMQRLSGNGLAFVEIDGDLVEIELQPGQQIVVDTGNVAGFESCVNMEIRQVPGVKNVLFGGEGLFNTVLSGPGKIWLQTMPISNVANALMPYMPTASSN